MCMDWKRKRMFLVTSPESRPPDHSAAAKNDRQEAWAPIHRPATPRGSSSLERCHRRPSIARSIQPLGIGLHRGCHGYPVPRPVWLQVDAVLRSIKACNGHVFVITPTPASSTRDVAGPAGSTAAGPRPTNPTATYGTTRCTTESGHGWASPAACWPWIDCEVCYATRRLGVARRRAWSGVSTYEGIPEAHARLRAGLQQRDWTGHGLENDLRVLKRLARLTT